MNEQISSVTPPLEAAPPTGANAYIAVDMGVPGGDRSVLTDGNGNSVDVTGATPEDISKIIARAQPPEIEVTAGPVSQNFSKLIPADGAAKLFAAKMGEYEKAPSEPEIEIFAINGLPVGVSPIMRHSGVTPGKTQNTVVQGGRTPGKTTIPGLPPGFDLTKQLVLNPERFNGKLGRKAARMQLQDAKKAQLKHLKEIGYFKNPPTDKP